MKRAVRSARRRLQAQWSDRPIRPCLCAECAELDLIYPGEGKQLALVLLPPPLDTSKERQSEEPVP